MHIHNIAEQFVVEDGNYHQTTLCLCSCRLVIICVALYTDTLIDYVWGEWRIPSEWELSILPKWAKEELQ